MPNWVYNRLEISGASMDLSAFADAVLELDPVGDEEPSPIDFERALPTPDGFLEGRADTWTPIRSAGDDTRWCAWRIQHWGTKWNAMWAELEGKPDDGKVMYSFSTAWSPPDGWLCSVSDQHRQLEFRHEYVEELAEFAGCGHWRSGSCVEHEELDPLLVSWVEWEPLGL